MKATNLITLNVPVETLRAFDHLCRSVHRPRSSVLVDMMRSFVLIEGKTIGEDSRRIGKIASGLRSLSKPAGPQNRVLNTRNLLSPSHTRSKSISPAS